MSCERGVEVMAAFWELEPMQPLIDLWAANGTFPPESKAYEYANVRAGERLLQLAGMGQQ